MTVSFSAVDDRLLPERVRVAQMLLGRRGELCGVGDSGRREGREYPELALLPCGETKTPFPVVWPAEEIGETVACAM